MDHRQSKRHLMNIDVNVYKDNMPVGPGKIHNISSLGAFLKIEPWRLSPHSIVKIIIPVNNENDKKIIQKGMIIHRSSEGVGLMFLDKQMDILYAPDKYGFIENICESYLEREAVNKTV